MEVHFTPELQAKVDSLAAEYQRDSDEYVQQLVENYLDHDAWFRRKVAGSLDKLDRGEFSHSRGSGNSRIVDARRMWPPLSGVELARPGKYRAAICGGPKSSISSNPISRNLA